jgi:hypothetical protein
MRWLVPEEGGTIGNIKDEKTKAAQVFEPVFLKWLIFMVAQVV